jgi:hypothetical protein
MVSIGEKGEYQVYLAAALMVANRELHATHAPTLREKKFYRFWASFYRRDRILI